MLSIILVFKIQVYILLGEEFCSFEIKVLKKDFYLFVEGSI
jgi:hypothetical protein